jgi:transposase
MTTERVYAGVDVSKDRLDVCLRRGEAERHDDHTFFVTHDNAGIDALISRLVEERPVLVILEATGGFERAVVAALAAEGLPVAVVNPR